MEEPNLRPEDTPNSLMTKISSEASSPVWQWLTRMMCEHKKEASLERSFQSKSPACPLTFPIREKDQPSLVSHVQSQEKTRLRRSSPLSTQAWTAAWLQAQPEIIRNTMSKRFRSTQLKSLSTSFEQRLSSSHPRGTWKFKLRSMRKWEPF